LSKGVNDKKKIKMSSNNFLWILIFEIIENLNISVELYKVKAHDTNIYNNRVDYLAAAAHLNVDNELLAINYQNIETIKWIPTWNNIVVEQNIRKFVTLTTNVKNLETFLNLNRNAKYRNLYIDWEMTFKNLECGESYFSTSFAESKFKRQKVKLLVEELSTIEQMKKSYYSLYKRRKCVYCNQEDETFNHIWSCVNRLEEINDLMSLHHEILKLEVNEYLKEKKKALIVNDILLNISDVIWNTDDIETKFNFTDIIKGFIPLSLTDKIFEITRNRESVKLIIYKYRQKFVSNINFFWKRRCDLTKELDKKLGIVKKLLKEHKGVEAYHATRTVLNIPKYEGLIGVRDYIYFGGKPLGFTIYMDLVNLIGCSLTLYFIF
jgi:hypothetical protein